jgi:lipopolysaccharide biosynthesis regulator YciM
MQVKWQLMVASCYRRTGQFNPALAKYKAILEKNPDNVECLKYLVHMCTSLGRKEEQLDYESRLRSVESQALQQRIRLQKLTESTAGQKEVQAKKNQDKRGGRTKETPEHLSSGSLMASQPPTERLISVKKFSSADEVWPELGDDLLPM